MPETRAQAWAFYKEHFDALSSRMRSDELPLLRYYANAIAEAVARAGSTAELEGRPVQRLGQFALAQDATPLAGT